MIRPEDTELPDEAPSGPEPAPMARLVAAVESTPGWSARLRGARVHGLWLDIAGEQLAAHVQPVRLVGGVLVVRASSPAWATQVGYLSGELAARANAVLGAGEVTRVTVVTGSQESSPQSSPRKLR